MQAQTQAVVLILFFTTIALAQQLPTFAGQVSGIAGRGLGDTAQASQACISIPVGMALDKKNNLLYFTAETKNRVRVWNLTSNIVNHVAGTDKIESSGDNAPASSASFILVGHLAFDEANNLLYVSDKFRVRVINLATNMIFAFAGIETSGFSGDGMFGLIL